MEQFTCRVDNQGRITLPVEWRKAHHIEPGSDVSVVITEDRLEVQTDDQSLDEARRIVAKHWRGRRSAVQMLRADRQQEAGLEQSEADAYEQGTQ
jgi:AbrB family looped-hinge helix DNA binding protein